MSAATALQYPVCGNPDLIVAEWRRPAHSGCHQIVKDKPYLLLNSHTKKHISADGVMFISEILDISGDLHYLNKIYSENPDSFEAPFEYVFESFRKAKTAMGRLGLRLCATEFSTDDECLFLYLENDRVRAFLNLFFDQESMTAQLNVSFGTEFYSFEGAITAVADSLEKALDKHCHAVS